MRHLSTSVLAAALAVGGTIAMAPNASAQERTCRGAIGAATLDNLVVPAGASCTLTGTTLKGTIKVEHGATLVADRARINGNLQCKENTPAPVGSGNTVGGNKEDQCARL